MKRKRDYVKFQLTHKKVIIITLLCDCEHCDVTRHLLSMNCVTSYYLGKVLYTHEPRDNHTHLLARFHSIKDA